MSTKQYINIKNKYDRFIVLIDMDCFYCQVEEKLNPEIKGKPVAVVQYNPYMGGGIIAVNYPARAKGVTRHMRGDEAKVCCPEIELVSVPCVRGKADLTKYRTASEEVSKVIQKYTPIFERASIDEAYLDITELVAKRLTNMNDGKFILQPEKLKNTFAYGYANMGNFIADVSNCTDPFNDDSEELSESEKLSIQKSSVQLLLAASIVNEIRNEVKDKTTFECSAGIAHNKILAKLACGLNKPNKQTIMPLSGIPKLYSTLPINKIKGLGAKFGKTVCESLGIQFMGDLTKFSEKELQRKFDDKNGTWLYLISRGIDLEAVNIRFIPKSIGSSKRFPGRNAITGLNTLNHWFTELSDELCERLRKDELDNNRVAKLLTVTFSQQIGNEDIHSSRSVPLVEYSVERIARDAVDAIRKSVDIFLKPGTQALNHPLKYLGVSASKFDSGKVEKKQTIQDFFNNSNKKTKDNQEQETNKVQENQNHQEEEDDEPESVPEEEEEIEDSTKEEDSIEENVKEAEEEVVQPFVKPPKETIIAEPQQIIDSKEEEGEEEEENQEVDELEKTVALFLEEEDVKSSEEMIAIEDNIETESVTMANTSIPIEEGESSKNCQLDYTKNYAEYHLPEVIAQTAFEICDQCNKRVPLSEKLTHYDRHFALQLSQQMREQYRSELKVSMSTKTSEVKKPVKTKTLSKAPSIAKFLSQKENSVENEDCGVKCEQCGSFVANEKLSEHLDYHFAQKLRMEECEILSSQNPLNKSTRIERTMKNPKKRPSDQNSSNSAKQFKAFFKK